MAIDGEEREEQPTLTTRQAGIQAIRAALDDQCAAQLDTKSRRRRQGHSNIVAIALSYNGVEVAMARLIRCECGFVARGETNDEVIHEIRDHMRTDHPALLESVTPADLLGWVQVE